MLLLPYENITYRTSFTEVETMERVREIANVKKKPLTVRALKAKKTKSNQNHTYEGYFTEKNFEIKRIITYRNSCLPEILGSIDKANDNSTLVNLKMRLPKFVVIFSVIWTFAICGMLIYELIIHKNSNEIYWPYLLMLLYGYILAMGLFKFESMRSKKYFKELLNAQIV